MDDPRPRSATSRFACGSKTKRGVSVALWRMPRSSSTTSTTRRRQNHISAHQSTTTSTPDSDDSTFASSARLAVVGSRITWAPRRRRAERGHCHSTVVLHGRPLADELELGHNRTPGERNERSELRDFSELRARHRRRAGFGTPVMPETAPAICAALRKSTGTRRQRP